MGFLKDLGFVMTYNEYKEFIAFYKKKGIMEFIGIWNAYKDKRIDRQDLHWGEEIEYHMYTFKEEDNRVSLSCDAVQIIQKFDRPSVERNEDGLLPWEKDPEEQLDFRLMPEFGQWMLEAIPANPYGPSMCPNELLSCFPKMKFRREQLQIMMDKHAQANQSEKGQDNLYMMSMASSPTMGLKDTMTSFHKETKAELEAAYAQENMVDANPLTESQFVPEISANPHPRFLGLAKSIRERREEKVQITVPLFQDVNTDMTSVSKEEPFAGQVYMDCMHFGMGCSCLQVTYETQSINHSRYLYDQFVAFTPIMSALSASSPIQKGKLVDIDLRWSVIEQSVDDRKPGESEKMTKSRYSTVNHYISNHEFVKESHNDAQKVPLEEGHMQALTQSGLDERLAYHIAAVFARDPVPCYQTEVTDLKQLCAVKKMVIEDLTDCDVNSIGSGRSRSNTGDLEVDEGISTQDHWWTKIPAQSGNSNFENIQSTNWNSLRWKPPPVESDIGWRVEFRPMDIMITDYENAAMTVVTGMLVNLINDFDLDFIMPISLVDVNMDRAHMKNAVVDQKFWFKTSIFPEGPEADYTNSNMGKHDFVRSNDENPNRLKHKEEVQELYIWQILAGDKNVGFPKGLIQLSVEYMKKKKWRQEFSDSVLNYFEFLLARAKGDLPSAATFVRDFVKKHPSYKADSIVPADVQCDLMRILRSANDPNGQTYQGLLGKFQDTQDQLRQTCPTQSGGQKMKCGEVSICYNPEEESKANTN